MNDFELRHYYANRSRELIAEADNERLANRIKATSVHREGLLTRAFKGLRRRVNSPARERRPILPAK